jgi:hypothetical protein
MTLVSSIIVQALRETNIIAVGANPTPGEAAEALDRLQSVVLSVLGNEVGYVLEDWNVTNATAIPQAFQLRAGSYRLFRAGRRGLSAIFRLHRAQSRPAAAGRAARQRCGCFAQFRYEIFDAERQRPAYRRRRDQGAFDQRRSRSSGFIAPTRAPGLWIRWRRAAKCRFPKNSTIISLSCSPCASIRAYGRPLRRKAKLRSASAARADDFALQSISLARSDANAVAARRPGRERSVIP